MSRLTVVAVTLGFLFGCGGLAQAQSWEASLLAGYTTSASLERRAPELSQLDVRGGFTLGAQVGRSFGPRWGAEVLWMRQHTAEQVGTGDGKADLFSFDMDDLHANAVYHFADPSATLRPLAFGGLGVTFLSGGGLPSETKLSWDLGGGLDYHRWKSIGFRGQVRYKPVILNDTGAGDFCDPFGFCQGWLHQFELAEGVLVRF